MDYANTELESNPLWVSYIFRGKVRWVFRGVTLRSDERKRIKELRNVT